MKKHKWIPMLAAALGAAAPARAERIVLQPVAAPLEERAARAAAEEWLRDGLAALSGAPVELLDDSCAPDEGRCLGAAARKLAADRIVSASIEARPRGYRFAVRAFAPSGAPRGEEAGEVAGGPLDLAGAVEAASCKVLSGASCSGTLRVRAEDGAVGHLFIDGRDAGALPIDRPLPVPVGRRALRLGQTELRVRVTVGRESRVAALTSAGAPALSDDAAPLAPPAVPKHVVTQTVTTAPRVSPPARSVAMRALFASGGALLAAAAGVELYARMESNRLDERYRSGALTDGDRSSYGQVRAAGIAATALAATGAGALACGGLLFLLTPSGAGVSGRF
jgi:hypothetical protein